jgi:hypothetical protein
MPTSLPPIREPESRHLDGLGADAWAGLAVIVGMFIVGVIYWSGHTNEAKAIGASASQATGASAAPKTITGSDRAAQ